MRCRRTVRLALAVVAAGLVAAPVWAADTPIPGKITIVKTGKLAKGVFKGTFPIPPAQPTGPVEVFDTGGGAGVNLYPTTAGTWKPLGGDGSKGWKYKGTKAPGDPCNVVLFKDKVIKYVCKGTDVTVNPPVGTSLGIILTTAVGDRFCAEFPAPGLKNDPGFFKGKDAPQPSVCPTPGVGTTTTTTTPGSTTTTTTLPGLCCGGFTRLAFRTTQGSGDCGDLLSTAGTNLGNLTCGGLYFGGGSVGVPLPAIIPDIVNTAAGTQTKVTACAANMATLTSTTAGEAGSNERCSSVGCLFGPPLPIPNYATLPISTCVINTVSTNATGTLNCATGSTALNLPLSSNIHLTGDLVPSINGIQPCPVCTAGTCKGGPNNTLPCTADTSPPPFAQKNCCAGGADEGKLCAPDGASLCPGSSCVACSPYPTSFDCPPPTSASIGSLPIAFDLKSGTDTETALASGSQSRVFCKFCRDQDESGLFQLLTAVPKSAKTCASNANCTDIRCVNNGVSPPEATTIACTTPGVQGTCPASHICQDFESCEQRDQGAFGNGSVKTIIGQGTAAGNLNDGAPHSGKLVSIFCIPPTFTGAVDASAGLPGPGFSALQGESELNP